MKVWRDGTSLNLFIPLKRIKRNFVDKTLKSNDMGLTTELLGSKIIFFVVKNAQQKQCKTLLFKVSKRGGFLMYLKCVYPRELCP